MSCDCEVRNQLFIDSNLKNLEKFSKKAFGLIKKNLEKNAIREIKKNIREVDNHTFKEITKKFGNSPRGAYNNYDNQILLQQNMWCIKTLIHENLHACSITARIPQLLKYRNFFEGITEFFAGYVLYKEYNLAYQKCWKGDKTILCSMSYNEETKTMISFTNFVPIEFLKNIYFGKTIKEWQKGWDEIEKYVQTKIKSKFVSPLKTQGMTFYTDFIDQCEQIPKFNLIRELNDTSMDISKILLK